MQTINHIISLKKEIKMLNSSNCFYYIVVVLCAGSLSVVYSISLPSWVLITICQCAQPVYGQQQQSLYH